MADYFVGEIRLIAFSFAPGNWALCDGSLQQISQYTQLYSLIGTTYGGDGITTFALPDLRSRTPIHTGTLAGNNYPVGQSAGEEQVTLASTHLPQHTHVLSASSNLGTDPSPKGNIWASSTSPPYSTNQPDTTMSAVAVTNSGSGLPHNNLSPFLAINFMIALDGIFPPKS